MPFDSTGTFTRTDGTRTGSDVWEQARDASVNVNASDADTHDQDIAAGLSDTVLRDGRAALTGNLPAGGNKVTNLADGTDETDAATFGQVRALSVPFVPAAQVGGTANAVTLSPTPSISAYETGAGFRFLIETDNTGNVTIAVSGRAAVSVRKSNGAEFAAGEWKSGRLVTVVYNGTRFLSDISTEAAAVGQETLTDGTNIAWDLDTAPNAIVTIAGNRTMSAPTNATTGAYYLITVVQDGSGNRTLTWNSAYTFTGIGLQSSNQAPVLATGANQRTKFAFTYENNKMRCLARLRNI